MVKFVAFLHWLRGQAEDLLALIQGIIDEAAAWNANPNRLPARFRKAWSIGLAMMAFLFAVSIVGAIAHRIFPFVFPLAIMTMIFYVLVTIVQWGPRSFARRRDDIEKKEAGWIDWDEKKQKAWNKEFSHDQRLKWAVQGIHGWLFWLVGAYALLFAMQPWQFTGWGWAIYGMFFLLWTFGHLCHFLDTLRIASKVIFMSFLVLVFLGRLGLEANNEIALRVASRYHLWESGSEIKRVQNDKMAEADKAVSAITKTQKMPFTIYRVSKGAPLRDEKTGKTKYIAGDCLFVLLVASHDSKKPDDLGASEFYDLYYLPDPLELEPVTVPEEKEEPAGLGRRVINFFKGEPDKIYLARSTSREFIKDQKVWIHSQSTSLDIEIQEVPRPRLVSLTNNNDSNGGNTIAALLKRTRVDRDNLLISIIWVILAAAILVLCLTKIKHKTACGVLSTIGGLILLCALAAGVVASFSLAPVARAETTDRSSKEEPSSPRPELQIRQISLKSLAKSDYTYGKYYEAGNIVATLYAVSRKLEDLNPTTASGRIWRSDYFWAAHPRLPFGTLVEVENTLSHQTVVVQIEDRGPSQDKPFQFEYGPRRAIDLFPSAFARIAGKTGWHDGAVPVTIREVILNSGVVFEPVSVPARPRIAKAASSKFVVVSSRQLAQGVNLGKFGTGQTAIYFDGWLMAGGRKMPPWAGYYVKKAGFLGKACLRRIAVNSGVRLSDGGCSYVYAVQAVVGGRKVLSWPPPSEVSHRPRTTPLLNFPPLVISLDKPEEVSLRVNYPMSDTPKHWGNNKIEIRLVHL